MMKSIKTLSLGILSDQIDYLHQLQEGRGLQLIKLQQVQEDSRMEGKPLRPFVYANKIVDVIIVYAHVGNNPRQLCGGIDWVQQFRLFGYDSPILLAVWENELGISNKYLLNNPFISMYCTDSCKIIKLPYDINLLENAILSLKPIDRERWEKCRKWLLRAYFRHTLTHIGRTSNLGEAKSRFKNFSLRHPELICEERVRQVMQVFDLNQFKSALQDLMQI
jgi:hypothetical protein